jgi:predicted RNase H-like HicB family nuclease
MKYVVVYEKGATGYGAYVPDLPGCVAVGRSLARVQKLIREAIAFHLDGLRQEGETVPPPSTQLGYVSVKLNGASRKTPRARAQQMTKGRRLVG